jgi:hypothetical protein
VQAKLRDAVIGCIEKQFIWAGAKSYGEGMDQARKLITKLHEGMEQIQTKEQLSAVLDGLPDPSKTEAMLIRGSLRWLPQLLQYGIKSFAAVASESLPALPRGRPSLEFQKKERIIAYIGQQFTRGRALETVKKEAAKRFVVSEATVQRIWDERANIDDVDFRSVLNFWRDEALKK